MQSQNKIFDDLSRVAAGAAGAAHSVKNEIEESFRAWLDRQLAGMDLVTREEFEVAREMAAKAREENEDLRAEIELLKAKLESKDEK